MSEEIPFKVSARTARLIGRENVSTAKGSIIELVKNGYDADSKVCVVYIDNFYANYHKTLRIVDYQKLLHRGIPEKMLESVYELNLPDEYKERDNVDNVILEQLKIALRTLTVLYIIDNGDGMTDKIIRDYWMTIGTDNKDSNVITLGGRVKVGAKGIGRFAMDKLGDTCEMVTFFKQDTQRNASPIYDNSLFKGFRWKVNWSDFEGTLKTVDSVCATLEGISGQSYSDFLLNIGLRDDILEALDAQNLSHGTMLKISSPRDVWGNDNIAQIYDDLGVLLPPSESNEFAIFLFASNTPSNYGRVEPTICDDYDYKLEAVADEHQNVFIKIFRNENDLEIIPASFFQRKNQKRFPYTIDDFKKGYWETTRSFSQLCPGFDAVDIDHVFNNVGKFEFLFYYLKRTTNSKEESRFFYRNCAYNLRKTWLDKYGGIKLFRDDFRVRPYGEKHDSAFDWLGLGARKAKNPAGIAKKEGGYKVEPENIAGLIKISRLTNVEFNDKSSREGLQENKTFLIFQEIIRGIISIFEEDRSCIARELDADDKERNWDARHQEEAEKLVQSILKRKQEKLKSGNEDSNTNGESDNASMLLLAESNRQKQEELDQIREEQKLLRVLASSGLMLAAFSHDLSKLDITLESRYSNIEKLFEEKLSKNTFANMEGRKNPYLLLKDARETDIKIQSWLNFAIDVIKKDKRTRKNIRLNDYFKRLKETWLSIFEDRAICFSFHDEDDIYMRIFEIDLDSIFHNLFSNSIEAFNLLKVNRPRTIDVSMSYTNQSIIIEYRDSGSGLSSDIVNPNDIFKPLYTTRRNQSTGENIGTGLGMWIIKSVIEDNDATAKILTPEFGFGIRFIFPLKHKRQ